MVDARQGGVHRRRQAAAQRRTAGARLDQGAIRPAAGARQGKLTDPGEAAAPGRRSSCSGAHRGRHRSAEHGRSEHHAEGPRRGRPPDAGLADDVETRFRYRSTASRTGSPSRIFWALAAFVFLQFFTRYVLNNSLAWTEEIARYLLIALTFIGAAMAVRKGTHIAVEFLYVYLPRPRRVRAGAAGRCHGASRSSR